MQKSYRNIKFDNVDLRSKDYLGTRLYSNELKEKIEDYFLSSDKKPLYIGIVGNWGSGKSTIVDTALNEIREKDKKIKVFTYDAWKYDGEGYYYTEESGYGAVIQYKKYKDFGADNGWGPFYLTNMESLFNNTTLYLANGSKPEYNGNITGSPGRYDNNVFIPLEKYREIYPDISDEAIVAMQENYDANNNWDQRVEYVPRVIEPPKPGTIDDYENPKDDSVKPTPGDNNPVIPDINDPITPPKSDVTILPDNKYNDAFPILTDGTLGYCEISNHHVLYEISGIDIDSYNDYILKIKKFGYTLNEDESMWIKDNYALTITIKDNNIIQIMAQIINGM